MFRSNVSIGMTYWLARVRLGTLPHMMQFRLQPSVRSKLSWMRMRLSLAQRFASNGFTSAIGSMSGMEVMVLN